MLSMAFVSVTSLDEEEESESTLPSSASTKEASSSWENNLNSNCSSGAAKRAKMSPSYVNNYQPMYLPPKKFVKRSISSCSNSTKTTAIPEDNSHMGMILQILSRYDYQILYYDFESF